MVRILVINGPNLNFLGNRSPDHYGLQTLAEIEAALIRKAEHLGVEIDLFQSNSESAIIDHIQNNSGQAQGIIINPGALTHYGYSLRDALADSRLPVVEVHSSNIHAREAWRRHSVVSDVAKGQITGLGWLGYLAALGAIVGLLEDTVHL